MTVTLSPVGRYDYSKEWRDRRAELGWWHTFEMPDGSIVQGVCDLGSQKYRIAQFPIPDDLRGKRVLDIGTWDGWFAFEMERRGADVVAVDSWDNPRFRQMHSWLNSRADYRQLDMYDMTPERLGRFDIVLFMGVLYHLKHPLLGLERVCALTTGLACVDSFVLKEKTGNLMEFFETDEFGGQTDNWCAPTVDCLMAFCRTAGFARVELRNVLEKSACIACFRSWDAPKSAAPACEALATAHSVNYGVNFDSWRDDCVSLWFRGPDNLTLDTVKPGVGGYGVRPISLEQMPGGGVWLVNFRLPPGLTRGWHEVYVQCGDGPVHVGPRIAVDVPAQADSIEIKAVCDGTSWTQGEVQSEAATLWIAGLPENADKNNLIVRFGGRRSEILYIEDPGPEARQVNVSVPGIDPGSTTVEASLGGASASISVNVTRSAVR